MKIHFITQGLALFLLALSAGAEATPLCVRESWSGYWGGQETTFHVENATGEAVGWRLAIRNQTVARGEARPANDGAPVVTVPMPPVKEGVALEAQLVLTTVSTSLVKTLHLFHTNAVAGRRELLESRHIRLFDPEGATAEVFDAAEIPYTLVANLSALDVPDSLIVVGEGVSLDEYPGLAQAIWNAAANGRAVLCLAPAEGFLPLPVADAVRPSSLALRDAEIVRELDKRLDAKAWAPDGVMATRHFTPAVEGQQIVARMTGPETGWPCLAIAYPGGGRVVLCAFDVVKKWQTGPAPRYLLVRLLEVLTEKTEEKKP